MKYSSVTSIYLKVKLKVDHENFSGIRSTDLLRCSSLISFHSPESLLGGRSSLGKREHLKQQLNLDSGSIKECDGPRKYVPFLHTHVRSGRPAWHRPDDLRPNTSPLLTGFALEE